MVGEMSAAHGIVCVCGGGGHCHETDRSSSVRRAAPTMPPLWGFRRARVMGGISCPNMFKQHPWHLYVLF